MNKDLILHHKYHHFLRILGEGFKKDYIKGALSLSGYRRNDFLKKAKKEGYTEIFSDGGSGCTCTLSENQSYCECDGNPYVYRYTGLSKKGKDYIKDFFESVQDVF